MKEKYTKDKSTNVTRTSALFLPIQRHEWRKVFLFTGLIILVTTLPYLIGWILQDREWIFTGFLFGTADGQAYLGRIRLGGQGVWSVYFFYTSEPHNGIPLLYWFYSLPGQVLGLLLKTETMAFHDAAIMIFHFLRIIGIIMYATISFRFISVFIANISWRFTAFFIVMFSGGFGWLVLFAGKIPIEFYIPEAFSIIIVAGLPHILFTRSVVFGGVLLLFKALECDNQNWWKWAVMAGLLWNLVLFAVPLYLVTLFTAIVIWGILSWIRWRRFPTTITLRTSVSVLTTAPLLLFLVFTFSQNEIYLKWKSLESADTFNSVQLSSPPPLIYVLSFGLLIGLAWFGIRWIWLKRPRAPYLLLIAWTVTPLILIYIPWSDQRRLMEGFILPVSILATLGLRVLILTRIKSVKGQNLAKTQVMFWSSLASVFFILFILYRGVIFEKEPIFMERPKAEALLWLGQNSRDGSVLLGAFRTSNETPSVANLLVFSGHGVETLSFEQKDALVSLFYCDELLSRERHILYEKYHIDYVFYGVEERELAESEIPTPSWMTELELIYEEGDYQIFAVPSKLYEDLSEHNSELPIDRKTTCGDADVLNLLYDN